MASETLHFENARQAQQLFNSDPRNLQALEEQLSVKATSREGWIKLEGPAEAVERVRQMFQLLEGSLKSGSPVRNREFAYALNVVKHEGVSALKSLFDDRIQTSAKKAAVTPKTVGQKKYLEAIREHDVTFGVGPAGTGKTYLAMAMAAQTLKEEKVSRVILTRPAVEAGERLGFLPGTLNDKIDPYLRPLYDALNEMMDPELVPKLMASGTIEVAPLAYMRGRTLNDSFVVLDEAQNTTPEQMKMFLTRLGFGTRMVVTGDITQVDLPVGASGLRLVTRVLGEIEDIHFAYLTSDDVVRHSLVGRIVDAYTEYDEHRLAHRRERDEASEFANRAERRTGAPRSSGPRDHLPKRGRS